MPWKGTFVAKNPIIGITAYPFGEGHGYHTPPLYVKCIVHAGGTPILFPPVGPHHSEDWLDVIDGLVLVGGGDIEPSFFTDKTHETIYNLNPDRDETELELCQKAIQRRKPILGICRGLQILNICHGGTLHLHLPDIVSGEVDHRVAPRDPVIHSVKIDPNSDLAKIIGKTTAEISSWHHQAIDQAPKGFKPVAWAEDGVVEAIEIDGHPEIIAVQWHPELTAFQDPDQMKIFEHFVTKCKKI